MLVPTPNRKEQTIFSAFCKAISGCGIIITLLFLSFSCTSPQKLVYFPNQQDTTMALAALPAVPEPVIQPNDILSITISSSSPEADARFNAPNLQVTTNVNSALGTQTGYLVDTKGYIIFPVIGSIKAAGLTKLQLANQLTTTLLQKGQLLNPVVTVRQLNYHITLAGEVARPGVYNIPSEKVSLFEALGQGGDLTPYANRETVVLIREDSGQRMLRRINLNSSSILTSPYYYLKSNDIVYAEPNKVRAQQVSNQGVYVGYGLSAVGILLGLVTLIVSVTR